MKRIFILITILLLAFQLKSQVPNNVTKPYSVTNKIEIDLNSIQSIDLVRPTASIKKANGKDIYAVDILTNINIVENGTKRNLANNKVLTVFRVKAEDAKSLNFSFENFYLSKNSKMFIYTLDKKQVMGPITRTNNNKVFNTHIILAEEVLIEIISDKDASDIINLTNVAYGIKDANYFMNVNEETVSNYSIQSSGCLQSMLDTKHDCNYLTLSSGASMKQANCTDFDDLEKSKRALCVIISHNSDDDPSSWEAKGGILINTASLAHPNQAENYCNNYILTCAHCLTGYWGETYPYIDPTNIVVRFNWLRKECEIPPSMPACNINSAAWEALINYDEVIDYCDVELLERDYTTSHPPLTAGAEYSILRINENLRFKEYYNGWKTYKQALAAFSRDLTILGAFGGNPFEGKDIIGSVGMQSSNIRFVYYPITSGHSGTSMFEQNLLVGINNFDRISTSIGTIYVDDGVAWPNTSPRDILDPDGIYATDYDNGDSIVVEGVERWEKSDCLKSAYLCNPSLDISEYLTPLFGVNCCFKLEYIDSFIGGVPYGIRIYRNNDVQQTIYYDFGNEIFAGSSTAYYNPLNDNVIEFCIDPEELATDGGKIVIEFLDNNGKIICRKVVDLECSTCCSDERLQIDLDGVGSTEDCCAFLIFTVDSTIIPPCIYSFANIYDNLDSTYISGFDIIPWQDTLLTVPMVFCNYDTIAKQLLIEFYTEDSTLMCSKLTNQFLPPCELSKIGKSEGNEKDIFDIKTKNVKQNEIVFEYFTKESEFIEIELFNKYNISLGILESKESKKGTSEFKVNIEKYKPGIYVFKMKGKNESVIRKLIIE